MFFLLIVERVGGIIRRLLRGRWSGRLWLDAGDRKSVWQRWLLVGLGSTIVLLALPSMGIKIEPSEVRQSLVFLLLYVGWVRSELMNGKLELRQKGIIGNGFYYAWDQIESWSRSDKAVGWSGKNHTVLKLEIRKRGAFGGSASLPVSPLKFDELSAVMNRFLGDWPARSDEKWQPQTHRVKPLTPYFAIAAIVLSCLAIVAATHRSSMNRFLLQSAELLHPRYAVTQNPIDKLDYVRIPAGSFLMGCSSIPYDLAWQ